jgi:hypothetical protein
MPGGTRWWALFGRRREEPWLARCFSRRSWTRVPHRREVSDDPVPVVGRAPPDVQTVVRAIFAWSYRPSIVA